MGLVNTVSLAGLPASERFDFWWETVAQSLVSVDASSEQAGDFWAELRSVDLGLVQVLRVRCASFEARRTPRRIRQSDAGGYQLCLLIGGGAGMRQGGREAVLTPADLMLYDTSRTFHAWSVAGAPGSRPPVVADSLTVLFPHTALPVPASAAERLLVTRLPGREGVGALLAAFLHRLMRHADQYTPADAIRLSTVLLDLLAALLSHELDVPPDPGAHDPHRVLLLRVQAFIEEHLGHADLSPATVAAAHHISVRHLQKIFEEHGLGVADWIRSRRLERCRRDLADPAQDPVPVRTIGARWGFPSPAHFTRAFHRAYGVPPARYRRRRRAPGGD
ncbi:helix-turn-helix domain-containing protein [Bailinhaonella thermotolerans]|uniref:Helix-turn-helix domain-containing protein n=1 Tax=Bailinhaonella thermotolerans TaxID=1070861 RepID=A0A3A4A519_9ACTN|nr:helix-turn-helix domain-containing protein [Bailinhaonella thermotolerans]RJL22941.1 helix-turn-helix domain-containing protein [Bailinhaonella thermotolerans]